MQQRKKGIAMILAGLLLAGSCGCSAGGDSSTAKKNTNNKNADSEQAMSCAYKSTALTEAGDVYCSNLQEQNGTFYLLKSDYSTEETVDTLCSYDEEGKETELFTCSAWMENETSSVLSYAALPDGTFAMAISCGSNPDMEYEPDNEAFDWEAYYDGYVDAYVLQIVDASGTVLQSIDTDASLHTLRADPDGRLFAFGTESTEEEGRASAYLVEGDTLQAVPGLENLSDLTGAVTGSDGMVYAMGDNDEGKYCVKKWNPDSKSFEEVPAEFSGSDFYYGLLSSQNPEDLLYLYNNTGIYALSADGTVSEKLNFLDSNLSDSSFSEAIGLADGSFFAVLRDNNYNSYLAKLTRNEAAGDLKTLTMAVYYLDSDLSARIADYNNSQDTYHISVKDYSEYNESDSENEDDWNKGETVFHEDIAAGNIPDLVEVSMFDAYSYGKKGLFVDLYPLMESDSTYSKADFLPNYLKANETDGALYWLGTGFTVESILANDRLTGGLTQWSVQEFLDICRECESNQIEIAEYQSKDTIYDLTTHIETFIDRDTNTCHFDDPSFVDALRFSEEITAAEELDYDNMTDSEWEAYNMESTMKYQNGERLLDMVYLNSYSNYATELALFGDESASLIGYPTLDGSNGSCFGTYGNVFAITSACADQAAAWEFLQSALEQGEDMENIYYFPVIRTQLEAYLKRDAETMAENYGGYTYNNVELDVKTPTDQDLQDFIAFLESIEKISFTDSTLTDMQNDAVTEFHAGNQTAEETAKLLQEKCSLYLKENG